MKKLLTIVLLGWAVAGFGQTAKVHTTNVTLLSIEGQLPPYVKCTLSPIGPVLLRGLPPEVQKDYAAYFPLNEYVKREEAQIEKERERIREQRAKLPTKYDYDSPAAATDASLTEQELRLFDRARTLDTRKSELQTMKSRLDKAAKFTVKFLGRYNGSGMVLCEITTNAVVKAAPKWNR